MSTLLPNTPQIQKATAADKMAATLDMLEANFLTGNQREKKIRERLGKQRNIIDISSATSMNLFHETTERKIASLIKQKMPSLLEKFHSYPYLIQQDFDLEKTFISFIRRWTKVKIEVNEVMPTPNGVYGSYKTILLSQPGKYVIVPELIHQINKACFSSLGKKVIEIPTILETGLLDLKALDKQLTRHGSDTACLYIYHTRPVKQLTRDYYLSIARLLKKYNVLGVIDLDSWYASYTPYSLPWLPLTIPLLRKYCLFLFTMTKEIGAPGLRIGFIVGDKNIINNLKRFRQISLEMDSPITRFLALLTLPRIDMDIAKKTLRGRMNVLVKGLRSLHFKVNVPSSGVNFFLHVPESFAASQRILPDHLFTYYMLKKAGILLRPASNHGHRLNHWVRFVLGQPEKVIEEMLERMRVAGMRGDMKMPQGLESEYKKFIQTQDIH